MSKSDIHLLSSDEASSLRVWTVDISLLTRASCYSLIITDRVVLLIIISFLLFILLPCVVLKGFQPPFLHWLKLICNGIMKNIFKDYIKSQFCSKKDSKKRLPSEINDSQNTWIWLSKINFDRASLFYSWKSSWYRFNVIAFVERGMIEVAEMISNNWKSRF